MVLLPHAVQSGEGAVVRGALKRIRTVISAVRRLLGMFLLVLTADHEGRHPQHASASLNERFVAPRRRVRGDIDRPSAPIEAAPELARASEAHRDWS